MSLIRALGLMLAMDDRVLSDCNVSAVIVSVLIHRLTPVINCDDNGGRWCGKMYHKPIQTSQMLLVKTPGEKIFSLEQM